MEIMLSSEPVAAKDAFDETIAQIKLLALFILLLVATVTYVFIGREDCGKNGKHASWVMVLLGMFAASKKWEGPKEADLQCDSSNWQPMIQPLGSLYIFPFLGRGKNIAKNIKQYFHSVLYMNILFPLGWRPPSHTMPTMDDPLNEEQLAERSAFFLPNYVAFVLISAAFWEFLWTICVYGPGLVERVKLMAKVNVASNIDAGQPQESSNALLEPLITSGASTAGRSDEGIDITGVYIESVPSGCKRVISEGELVHLGSDFIRGGPAYKIIGSTLHVQSHWRWGGKTGEISGEKGSYIIEFNDGRKLIQQARGRRQSQLDKAKAATKAAGIKKQRSNHSYKMAFTAYWLLFQVLLYVWTDVTVAGGLMNVTSGVAYEMWTMAIQVEYLIQTIVLMFRYAVDRGMPHQHPSSMIIPVMLPLYGNLIHIWKDHATQGLSFAMAHCASPHSSTLGWIGTILGYLGFIATFWPAFQLLRDDVCHQGLRQSHWPVAEAGLVAKKRQDQQPIMEEGKMWGFIKAQRPQVVGVLISLNTKEKWVKTKHGEIPHIALHIVFVYFFGGSDFIYFSIFVSLFKLLMFPMASHLVPVLLEKDWGCSKYDARKYMVNREFYGYETDKIHELSASNGWVDILKDFWAAVDCDAFILVDSINDATSTDEPLLGGVRELTGEVAKVEVSVDGFEDQAYGNKKTSLLLCLCDANDVVRAQRYLFGVPRTKSFNLAPIVFTQADDIVYLATSECHYSLEYTVGGGGGHRIYVQNLLCKIWYKGST